MSNGSECPGWEIVPSPQEIISGTIAPFADPETVSISFAAKQAMMIVSRLVRLGWMVTPPEGDQGPGAVGSWMQQHSNLEPLVESELNPDTEDVYSEWRKSLYHTQNHIFYDIMNFTVRTTPIYFCRGILNKACIFRACSVQSRALCITYPIRKIHHGRLSLSTQRSIFMYQITIHLSSVSPCTVGS